MTPAPIVLILGASHESDYQVPGAKHKHSKFNRKPVRGHHNFGTSSIKKTQIFIY